MEVIIDRAALKTLKALNEPLKTRMRAALCKLENEPPTGDIKPLSGTAKYRMRVGDWRIIFSIADGKVRVADIAPRGQVYKGV